MVSLLRRGRVELADDRKLADAVWTYPQGEGDAAAVRGYLSFLHDELTVEVAMSAPPVEAASAG